MTKSSKGAVPPTNLGFHCNGECWSERNGIEGLLGALESHSIAKRDWFAASHWANPQTLRSWKLPPKGSIHPLQDYVHMSTVEFYQSHGLKARRKSQAFFEQYPTLFKWQGKYFIFQGTHRLAAAYAMGASHFSGWLLDLDA